MSRFRFRVQQLTVIVAASYVTLCFADTADARNLAIPYGLVTLALATVGAWTDWRHGR